MKLLVFGGDASCARGLKGPHHNLLEEFHGYWDRIDYLCPPHPEARPTTLFDNVHFHPAPPGRLKRLGWLKATGLRLAREHQHHLVAAHEYAPFFHGAAARTITRATGIPHVLEVYHVEGHPRAADWGERLRCLATALYLPRAARSAKALRVINQTQIPNWLRGHGIADEKIRLLYSSYTDFDLFKPQDDVSKDIDVLFIGRLVRNKGLETLVEAVTRLDPVPVTRLIGVGPLRERLEARLQKLGCSDRVTFHGWAEDSAEIAGLVARSRSLVCASLSEGGPRTTLEAMAAAVPVVTTPVGTMPDMIDHRINGCLCGFDAASLSQEIAWILEDPERATQVGRAGHEAAKPFERKTLIRAYAEGYQELARP